MANNDDRLTKGKRLLSYVDYPGTGDLRTVSPMR
jgi:hypothetical protein